MQRESQPLNPERLVWSWRKRSIQGKTALPGFSFCEAGGRKKAKKAGVSSLYATNGAWLRITRQTDLRRVQGGADQCSVLVDAFRHTDQILARPHQIFSPEKMLKSIALLVGVGVASATPHNGTHHFTNSYKDVVERAYPLNRPVSYTPLPPMQLVLVGGDSIDARFLARSSARH